MPTKDELEAENADLRAQLARAEIGQGGNTGGPGTPARPQHPDFGLSAGEVFDLQSAGVTTSPFTGQRLNALDLGITPGNPEALRAAQRDQAARNVPDPEPVVDEIAAPDVPAGVKAAANAMVSDDAAAAAADAEPTTEV